MSTCLLLRLVYNYVLSKQFSHFISKGVSKKAYVVGKCISARAHPLTTHIPFRDSKLTRLLQESLGGIVVFDILFFKNMVYAFITRNLHQTALKCFLCKICIDIRMLTKFQDYAHCLQFFKRGCLYMCFYLCTHKLVVSFDSVKHVQLIPF